MIKEENVMNDFLKEYFLLRLQAFRACALNAKVEQWWVSLPKKKIDEITFSRDCLLRTCINRDETYFQGNSERNC